MESPAEILRRHGLRAKHSWGQNFLGDEGALRDIAGALALREGEPVVELGPGLGHLTRFLAATGAKVTAVERDRDMVAVLHKEAIPGVRVVEGNATHTDFAKVGGADVVAVAGNLPYHLTSPILFEVLEQRDHVSRAVFTLQKEVVERLAAEPGTRDYGLLTVLLGLYFDVEYLFTLEARRFTPPPKVDSAVVRLVPRKPETIGIDDPAVFSAVVRDAFGQRRKTLRNALSNQCDSAAIEAAGVRPDARAEQIDVADFVRLANSLARQRNA